MEKLEDIIAGISKDRSRQGVERVRTITLDSMDRALAAIEMLGRRRTPGFVIDDANRWVYTQLIKWLYGDPTMQALDAEAATRGELQLVTGNLAAGLYLSGPTGTGKSLALELLDVMADIDQPAIRIDGKDLCLHYSCHRAEDIWEECAAGAVSLERYKSMPVLCIQDLGSEPESEAVHMGTRREPLRQILEARGDRCSQLTLISSNHGPCDPEIKRRYTERTVSRLRGMCNLLVLNGPDRRKI